ncbi:hypothetical protein VYU27_010576, partial [Nannochloropsis oceanica]
MVGTKEQIFLLQKLQLATVGGEGGEGGREGGRKQGGRGGGKYTRNRSRALKATKAGGRDGGREGGGGASSIVPQDEGFDPLLFLSVVHGGSSWEEVVKGQGYLERSLGTQASALQQLVRDHYEAFVRCADGIHWLKDMVASQQFLSLACTHGRGREGGREGGSGTTDPAPHPSSSSSNGNSSSSSTLDPMLKMTHATREEATRLFLPLLLALERQKRTRARRVLLQRLAK